MLLSCLPARGRQIARGAVVGGEVGAIVVVVTLS